MTEKRIFTKQLKIKQSEMSGKGEVRAVLSTTGNIDLVGDKFLEGAFDKFIDENPTIPMLWSHSASEIIGDWKGFEIDNEKLMATGQLFEPVQRAREASQLLKAEMIKGVSIGFIPLEYTWNYRDEESMSAGVPLRSGFDFSEVKLLEASLVLWPANPEAAVDSVKNKNGSIDIRKLERHLAKTDLTRSESSTIIQSLSLMDSDNSPVDDLSDSVIAQQEIQKFITSLREHRGA